MKYEKNLKRIHDIKQTIDQIDDLLDQAMDLTYCIENLMIDMKYELAQEKEEELLLCL